MSAQPRPRLWKGTVWFRLRYARESGELVRDLLRAEIACEHPASQSPDPYAVEEVAFSARRLALVERQVVEVPGGIRDVVLGRTQAVETRAQTITPARVRRVYDADTIWADLVETGERVEVRLPVADAAETPKSGSSDTRYRDFLSPHNQHMTDPELRAHVATWAVFGANDVRSVLTPEAPPMTIEGGVVVDPALHQDYDGEVVYLVRDLGQPPQDDPGLGDRPRQIYRVQHPTFGGDLERYVVQEGYAVTGPWAGVEVRDGRLRSRYDELAGLEAEARANGVGAFGADPALV